ncbi:hypothetical protein L208DRAFT_1310083, partial [Tricholoma matsutake]
LVLLYTCMATLANILTLVPNLSIKGLFTFIYIAKQLRDNILLPQPAEEPEDNAPEILPPSVTRLLANSCNIQIEDVDVLWMELWHLIWDEEDFPRHNLAGTILKYGHGLGFAPDTLYPPQHSCIQPVCSHVSKGLCLKKTYYQKVVLYTLDQGAVPVYAISLYCECAFGFFQCLCNYFIHHTMHTTECKTSYHHNYYIKQDFWYYYAQQPPIIEVGEHQFVNRKVIDLSQWASSKAVDSWLTCS